MSQNEKIERNVSKVQLWQNDIMMTLVKPEEVDGILESWKSRGLKHYDGGHYIGFETPEYSAEREKVRKRIEKREARRLAKLGVN
jgi:hypothetical protein